MTKFLDAVPAGVPNQNDLSDVKLYESSYGVSWGRQFQKRGYPQGWEFVFALGCPDKILHSGSGDIVMGNKTVGRQATTFTPGPQHITPETARKLSDLVKEIVERLTVSGGNVQKAFQRVWGDFNRHFGLTIYRELPREKADQGINYLRQWRASKNSRLRFADPEKFRIAQLKGIWPRAKALGLDNAAL